MIRIDDTLLEEIGLITLPKAERDQLLRQIYETLEMRVGMKLAERMSDQQLDEFERFIDTNDEAGALKWLESNFPDYKQVVASELDKLKGEIKQDSGKIIEAMQASGAQTIQAQAQTAMPAQAPPVSPVDPNNFNNPVAPQPLGNNVVQGNFGQAQVGQVPQQGYQNIPPPPTQSSYDENQQNAA